MPDVRVAPGAGAMVTIELVATPKYLERVQITASKAPLGIGEIVAQADVVERSAIDEDGDQRLMQAISSVGKPASGQPVLVPRTVSEMSVTSQSRTGCGEPARGQALRPGLGRPRAPRGGVAAAP